MSKSVPHASGTSVTLDAGLNTDTGEGQDPGASAQADHAINECLNIDETTGKRGVLRRTALNPPRPAASESPGVCGRSRLSTEARDVPAHRRGRPRAA